MAAWIAKIIILSLLLFWYVISFVKFGARYFSLNWSLTMVVYFHHLSVSDRNGRNTTPLKMVSTIEDETSGTTFCRTDRGSIAQNNNLSLYFIIMCLTTPYILHT